MTVPVIELRALVHDFGTVRAVDRLDLRVGAGEVVGLLGHNGAGKTTTLRHITGILAPSGGAVRVFGADPVADGVTVRRRLGVLPAAPSVDDHLTGRANLQFVADLWSVDQAARRIDALLDEFGLLVRADERAGDLSTGMRQRLALARVLVHDPELLLLDEPTASLDPVAAHQFREVVGHLARDERRTVVLSTHNLEEAERLCDRVVILDQGRVAAQGAPADLIERFDAGAVLMETDPVWIDVLLSQLRPDQAARATVEGNHVRFPGTRAEVPGLLASLTAAHVPVYAAYPEQATLEDVYLALHREQR